MNEYYDIIEPISGFCGPEIQTTITKIWLSLQSQVLNTFLYSQVFFLLVVILTLEVLRGKGCTWREAFLDSTPKHLKRIKATQIICSISLPLAIYGVLLCISVKMGLNL